MTHWIRPRHRAFLVPVRARSVIVRAKMCAALNRAGFLDQIPAVVWTTPGVVHAQPAGTDERVLDYLARYLLGGRSSDSLVHMTIKLRHVFEPAGWSSTTH